MRWTGSVPSGSTILSGDTVNTVAISSPSTKIWGSLGHQSLFLNTFSIFGPPLHWHILIKTAWRGLAGKNFSRNIIKTISKLLTGHSHLLVSFQKNINKFGYISVCITISFFRPVLQKTLFKRMFPCKRYHSPIGIYFKHLMMAITCSNFHQTWFLLYLSTRLQSQAIF